MKSKKVEIMGKVFTAASIVAMAPAGIAMHQGANKAAMHAADTSAVQSCALADILSGMCPDDDVSWS